MVKSSTEGRKPGDLLIHVESLEYCTITAKIRNNTGTSRTLSDPLGYPLIAGTNGADYNLAVAGQEASVVALLVDGPTGQDEETIAGSTNSALQWQVLKNPPAIINRNQIRTKDIAAADFDVAGIVTALKALKFEVRDIPAKTETL